LTGTIGLLSQVIDQKITHPLILTVNLPRGARTLYAAQTVCVDFHSSPDDGACARLPQNENSYMMNLGSLLSQRE